MNSRWKRVFGWTLVAVLLAGGVGLAQDLTADDILDRMEEESDALAQGSMISKMRVDVNHPDGTTTWQTSAVLSKPDRTLIYQLEPEDDEGSMWLIVEQEDDDSRLWMYLPALGIAKELVTEEQRGGSFAGSSISLEDIGGGDQSEDYDAVLVGEEALTIDEEERTAYVVESTAKPDANEDIVRTVLWVDKESFVMLKMEGYNDLGNLEQTLDVLALAEFEGHLIAEQMVSRDVLEESQTTITILERRRSAEEIPDEGFDPENLASFDPTAWGL